MGAAVKEYWIDPETGEYVWVCPECKTPIRVLYKSAVIILIAKGKCQGCRARDTFARVPGMRDLFLEFWERTGYPQSSSWAADLPTM